MDEPIGPAEIDESAEISQAGDAAVPHLAGLQLGQQAIFLLCPPFLGRGPLRQDEPIAPPVHLDDLEIEGLAAHRAQLLFDLFLAATAA